MTQSDKLENRIAMSFCSRMIMVLMVLPFFSCEWINHNGNEPIVAFNESFYDIFTIKKGFVLQGFIICYFCMFFMSIYLNAISTNYNMILSAASVPSVALFYTIIPEMRYGPNYPIWITILSMVSIILSIYFWTKGDTRKPVITDGYYLYDEENNNTLNELHNVINDNSEHSENKN